MLSVVIAHPCGRANRHPLARLAVAHLESLGFMRRVITWQVVWSILAVSFIGLFACRLVDRVFYAGTDTFGKTPVGSFITIVFAIAWCIGLIVFVPLRVAWDRSRVAEVQRQMREGEIDPTRLPLPRQMIFYANFGNLPKWLYLPVVAVAWLLVAIFVLIVSGLLIAYVTGKL
jgi:hypothetical protein